MARRTFTVVDVTEVLIHWYAGRSKTELADSLGIDRKTIRKYLAPAVAAGITPGGPPMTSADWAGLVREWFPQLADTRLRQITWPQIAAHHEFIKEMLPLLTMATIHQRLRDEHGLDCSASSLRRYVRANLPEEARRDQVVVLREPAVPGGEAQIDYGSMGMWTDPRTGKRHRIWAFVMVLAASRHMFVRPVLKMDQHAWCTAHVEAFSFFGGVPARLVPDNLRTGVERPDLYDPKINRAYAELAEHYGTLVDPARSRKPRDKGRVERPMPYIRDSWWRGREFATVEEMQRAARAWSTEVAGQRSCRPLEGAAPAAVFAATEAEALAPLPVRPFVLARWSRATVGPDIHIKCGRTLYSVPWRFIGKKVDVRSTHTIVQVFHEGELVKTHAAAERGKRTDAGDYPPEKIAFQMRTPSGAAGSGADRARRDGGHRRPPRGERALPAPGRPGRARPGEEVRARAPGGCLREGRRGRRPFLPHRQGHPRGRHRAAAHRA
ncbi:IS21 family transposase [Streptomyces olivoreticuli]|nr:IS21 family transposase [Streptomyces olivoreticuli]WKK24175.1 IS21 family transposase [Streptomyces olivoreticuli]